MATASENLAMVLTPPGAGAVAVVRLSGPAVAVFISKHCSILPKPGRVVHAKLNDKDRVIDDPVFVLHSDSRKLDINLHGSAWIVHETMELARQAGFAVHDAQAASASMDKNPIPAESVDGHDEIESEILQYLPQARTELAIRVLLNQKQAWKDLERSTDVELLRSMLQDHSLQRLLNPPRVAIVGVPNVGKSTLANQLFAAEHSITADVPGTTRDWVGHIADIDGLAVMLVDTPGQRETSDAIESAAIDVSRGQIERADLVVVVLDPTQSPFPQQEMLNRHAGALVVVNKSDQMQWPMEHKSVLAGCGCHACSESGDGSKASDFSRDEIELVRISALSGEGIGRLRQNILGRFGLKGMDHPIPRIWTVRQKELVTMRLNQLTPAGDNGTIQG